jgi:large subunit ribosomal protein L13
MAKQTIDAKNRSIGRLATEVAHLLRGKHKTEFQPHLDTGDEVVVVNTDKIRVTGNKMKDKIYYRHSGYPGGLKEEPLEKVFERDSREVVKKAVYGMLPKNKLRKQLIKKLELYKDKGPTDEETE